MQLVSCNVLKRNLSVGKVPRFKCPPKISSFVVLSGYGPTNKFTGSGATGGFNKEIPLVSANATKIIIKIERHNKTRNSWKDFEIFPMIIEIVFHVDYSSLSKVVSIPFKKFDGSKISEKFF